ncbi:MAG: murein biosynthesis integral membrane protein MurJ [Clostridiales bacterium]
MGNSVSRAALVVVIMNLLAKVLGFLREVAIAGVFGATMQTDAYNVAYTLPYSLQQVLGQALLTITVPLLTKYLVEEKRKEANLMASYLVNATAGAMIVLGGLGVLFAPLLVKVFAPSLNGEVVTLAVQLTRIMFPAIIFMSIGMVFSGVLNANRKFLSGAFAPAFSSLIIIISVITLGKHFGIQGLAYGTLLSFVGFLLVILPGVKRTGYTYTPKLSLKNEEIRTAMLSLVPIVLGTSVNQIYYILNRIFASGLPEGSISVLNYASKVVGLPSGIFVAAIAVAIYPSFTEYALKGQKDYFVNSLEKGMGIVMLLAIPSTIGLVVLANPIVSVLFQRGAFDQLAALNTADALIWYSIGLFPYAAILVLMKAFYAFGDVKLPIYAGIFGIITNVVVSFITMGFMGHTGLALATSLASTVNMLVFFVALKKHLPTLKYRPFVQSFAKITISSLGMGAGVLLVGLILSKLGITGNLPFVLCGILVGVAIYFALVYILKVREIMYLKEIIMKKVHRG